MEITYWQKELDQCFELGMELHQFNFPDSTCFGFITVESRETTNAVAVWKLKHLK